MKNFALLIAIVASLVTGFLCQASHANPQLVKIPIKANGQFAEKNIPIKPCIALDFQFCPVVIFNGSVLPVRGGVTFQDSSDIFQIKCTEIEQKALPIPPGGCGNKDYIPVSCSFRVTSAKINSAQEQNSDLSQASFKTKFKPTARIIRTLENRGCSRSVTEVSKKPLLLLGFPKKRSDVIFPPDADYVIISPYGASYFPAKEVESGKLLQNKCGNSSAMLRLQRKDDLLYITLANMDSKTPHIINWSPTITGNGISY